MEFDFVNGANQKISILINEFTLSPSILLTLNQGFNNINRIVKGKTIENNFYRKF
jgi:hypothetical protein